MVEIIEYRARQNYLECNIFICRNIYLRAEQINHQKFVLTKTNNRRWQIFDRRDPRSKNKHPQVCRADCGLYGSRVFGSVVGA